MSVLLVVLPLALAISALAVWAFVWSVRGGQLDDLETPAQRALLDDDPGDEGAELHADSPVRRVTASDPD